MHSGSTIEIKLLRARDCSAAASLMVRAACDERRWIGRQIANVLAALPEAQAELAAQNGRTNLSGLQALIRQVGMLETIVLDLTDL